MFSAKIRKNNIYTPVNYSSTIKLGFEGSKLQGCVSMFLSKGGPVLSDALAFAQSSC